MPKSQQHQPKETPFRSTPGRKSGMLSSNATIIACLSSLRDSRMGLALGTILFSVQYTVRSIF